MENLSEKKVRPPNPREHANVLSALTFSWLLGIFLKGFKRDLEVDDLYEALKEHRSDSLGDKFENILAVARNPICPGPLKEASLGEELYDRQQRIYSIAVTGFLKFSSRSAKALDRHLTAAYPLAHRVPLLHLTILRWCIAPRQDNKAPVALEHTLNLTCVVRHLFGRPKVWEKEVLEAKKKGRSPSFLCVIVRIFFWRNVFYSLILAVTELGIRLVQPFFIGLLVQYFSIYNQSLSPPSGDDPTYMGRYIEILTHQRSQIQRPEAIFYASGIVIISFITIFVNHPYMLAVLHQGMKIRVACCSIIYRKALRLSRTALGETTVGQVVNLLSNDVNRFDSALIFLHSLWIGPVETVIVSYFMYEIVGWPMFLGVIFLLLLIPLQGFLGKKMSVYRLRTAIRTDERVRLMNEIIGGIQVIKMYTWEFPFAKLVAKAREKEIREIKGSAYVRGILLSFIIFSTRFALFLTVVAFALKGDSVITAEKIFVLTSFYNILRQTMTVFFPAGIAQLAEAFISVKRIQEFMLYEENVHTIRFSKDDGLTLGLVTKSSSVGIKFDHVTAKWIPEHREPTLNDVTVTVTPGRLLAVIGPVGSGKSSFLQAILKELPTQSGNVTVNGVVSYAAQEPWLFVGSVRQNILFGMKYDRQRYQKVVQVCSLKKDFELLPYGDKTIVGERGVSLSGGQRARINLARAVYKEADIYLLDDPLSAVDTHVGKHLFEDCIAGFLKSKTVILVTHQLQYLSSVDHIIILSNGAIQAEGSYQELQKSGLDFAELLLNPETHENPNKQEPSPSVSARKNSVSSTVSVVSEEGREDPTIVAEQKTQRVMSFKFYVAYFAACRNWCLVFLMAFSFVATQVFASLSDYWCGKWAQDEELNLNKTSEEREQSTMKNVYIFSGFSITTILVTLFRSYLFFYVCMMASKNLHDKMFANIICAPMRFFHTNPSGRVLNRFSKDIGAVDEILPSIMIDCFQIFFALFGIVLMVAVVSPILLVPTFIIGIFFYLIRTFYIRTSRSIKGLEAITRTPVFSHLNATLQGLTTIRAFGAQKILIEEFDYHQDLHSSAWYLFISTSRAFGFWLDNFSVVYIGIVTFAFLIFDFSTGADVGLAITQSLALTGMFQWGMRQSAELENYMTSVERILEYTNLEKEPPLDSKPDKKPSPTWPNKGEIVFEKTYLRYDPEGLPVLHGISLRVSSQEKIGIVGRTGAGKSTLIAALFRLAFVEGKIIIDGIETTQIGLHDLRSKISIIPQEPVLFSGSLRYNLDPFDEYPDYVLWQALEEVELKEVVEENEGLNSKMSEGGANFSVGQRQLLCLARAIIRNNKILIMDEATANVDPQTDRLIQKTIRRKFKDCTVLTIAHRLNTVMDSDRILVIDAGKVVEFDHPHILLQQRDGYLRKMVLETGTENSEELKKIAERNYKLKTKKEG